MISFAHPLWILAGFAVSLLLWFLWSIFEAKRKVQLQLFAAAPLLKHLTANVSSKRRLVKKILLLGAVFCCFVALARPQYGYRWVDVKHKGIDILFALDTSKSMLVEDIRPNRLERSKLAIMDFVSQLGGDRVGLMPFAGSSYLICPLTADYFAFEQSLAATDTSIIPTGGTDIGQAIESAEKTLGNEANHKILVLITDGENLQGDALAAAVQAHKENMTIYAVGVGTGEGELIPDKTSGGFVKDNSGSYVKSRLDERGLTALSEATGGFYVPLGNQGQGLETIYQQKLALIPKTELAERRKKLPIDRFEWPLAVAILLMSLEFILSGRKKGQTLPGLVSRLTRRKAKAAASVLPILISFFLSTGSPARGSEGESAYETGNYLKASEYYQGLLEKDPDNPQLLFNSGAVAYKNNLLEEAVENFEKTLSTDDVNLQEKAYYNLGNVHYRKGEEALNSDQQATIKQWEQSLKSYQGALSLNPDNQDAQYNHDIVKSRLDQLKQQQPESNEQQEDGENSEDQQNNQDNQNNQNKQDKQDQKEQQSGQQEENGSDNKDSSSPESEETTGQNENQEEKPSEENQETDQPQENQTATPENAEQEDQGKQSAGGSEASGQNAPPPPGSLAEAQAMTQEEAEQLLQAVQNEEGRLNLYIPMQENKDNKIRKDW